MKPTVRSVMLLNIRGRSPGNSRFRSKPTLKSASTSFRPAIRQTLLFLIGGFWKYLFGKRFVFDHHDINPELFEAKFNKQGRFHKLLLWLEKLTFKTADVSIATNETFKDIAIQPRRHVAGARVHCPLHPGPDALQARGAEPGFKNGRKHLIGYVGIMGAQDGVDLLVDAMDEPRQQQRAAKMCSAPLLALAPSYRASKQWLLTRALQIT